MRRSAALTHTVATSALLVTASLAIAHAAPATTAPGVLSTSQIVITDKTIVVHIRRHRWSSTVHYTRGAELRYEVVNRGTRSFSLDILGSTTGRLVPSRRASILVYWLNRGRFVFQATPNGPKMRVFVR